MARTRRAWSLSASAGLQYDDNVTIDEVDQTSEVGDEALLLGLSASYRLPVGAPWTLEAGYDFSLTDYRDLSQFDSCLSATLRLWGCMFSICSV